VSWARSLTVNPRSTSPPPATPHRRHGVVDEEISQHRAAEGSADDVSSAFHPTWFAGASHATLVVNDGKSLAAVADDSIDFAFLFDSLVHVEMDLIEAYLHELSRKLSPDGIAFIHHSNLGEYSGIALNLSRFLWGLVHRWPLALKVLVRMQLTAWEHWRAPSVTSRKVVDVAKATGLVCIAQE
jgi:hypothetical protein